MDRYVISLPKKYKNQKPQSVEIFNYEEDDCQIFYLDNQNEFIFFVPEGLKYNPNNKESGFDVIVNFEKQSIQYIPFLENK